MSCNNQSLVTCGQNPCYRIFTGRRIVSDTLPTSCDFCYLLRCSDSALFQKQNTGSSNCTWARVNVPPNTPFIFYDLAAELICLINFGSTGGRCGPNTPVNPMNPNNPTPVIPVAPGAGGGGNGGSVVGPVVSALPFANGTTSVFPMTSANFNVVSNGNVVGATTPVMTSNQAGDLVVASIGRSSSLAVGTGSFVGANVSTADLQVTVTNGSVAGEVPQENGQPSDGTVLHGRATAGPSGPSVALVSDNGAYAQFHLLNNSVVHADQDASHAGGLGIDCSAIHAAAPSSMARGTASDRALIRTGGMPMSTGLPSGGALTVAQVGFGRLQNETIQAVTIDTTKGCTVKTQLFEDISPERRPPLGFFSSRTILGSVGAEHAPGVGHGAVTSGLATSDASLLATANGALSVGHSRCEEVQQAVGLASQALGRANQALGAYSMAQGHNALAYMHASRMLAVPTPINANVQDNADRIQVVDVPLQGYTTCERVTDGTNVTSFRLTTILVLGDTPNDAVIDTPNGPTLDFRRVPFLPYNGAAIVNAQLVTPRLISDDTRYVLPAFGAEYCFLVTRTGSDNQFSHIVSALRPKCIPVDGPQGDAALTITTVSHEGQGGEGFTIQIVENIPFTVTVDGVSVPNPRITPRVPTPFLITNQTDFRVQGRLYGGSFHWTESPSGSTEIICPGARPPTQVVVSTAGVVNNPLTSCPECNTCNANVDPVQTGLSTTSFSVPYTTTPLVSLNTPVTTFSAQPVVNSALNGLI